jgi:hypothetical protein
MKINAWMIAAAIGFTACGTAPEQQGESKAVAETSADEALAAKEEKTGILELGADLPAGDVALTHIDDTEHTLESLAGENGLLVIFSCNTCPFVVGNGKKSEGWEGRYASIYDHASQGEIGMALINPNEAKRTSGDGLSDMKERYATQGLKGPYLLDANHVVADAFGALTTPHVFLFDGKMKLIYKGAIDDNVDSKDGVKEPYLKKAIDAHLAGEPIDPNSTRQLGCSIKRVKA